MCAVIFMSNPTTVLRLCCIVVGVLTTTTPSEYLNQLLTKLRLKLSLGILFNDLFNFQACLLCFKLRTDAPRDKFSRIVFVFIHPICMYMDGCEMWQI